MAVNRGPYVAQYLPRYIKQGFSGRRALTDLRSRGFSISDRSFYRLWGETQDTLSRQGQFVDAPLNRVISPDQMGRATRPKARGPLYQVNIAVEDPETGEISYHAWAVRSSRALSHGTILRRAITDWESYREGEQGALYGRALGAFLQSAVMLIGEDE